MSSKPSKKSRTLRVESLEARSLMAADIVLFNGVANIMSTSGKDTVEIAPKPNDSTSLVITVKDTNSGQILASKTVPSDSVKNIVVSDGEDGDTTVLNQTEKPSVTFGGGGAGWTKVLGGTNRDIVFYGYLANPQFGVDYNINSFRSTVFVQDGLLIFNNPVEHQRIEIDEVLTEINWWEEPAPTLRVTAWSDGNPNTWFFPKSQVRHLVIQGSHSQNDHIVNRTDVPATIFGGGLHDSIQGGSATDLIFGGSGWDRVYGGAGNDILYGGTGDDVLVGESGADQINGDEDNDTLYAGGVNDRKNATHDYAVDVLFGGEGRDTFYAYFTSGSSYNDSVLDWSFDKDGLLNT